jgi:hypothetical protein
MQPMQSSGKRPEPHNALPSTRAYRRAHPQWNKAHQGSARAEARRKTRDLAWSVAGTVSSEDQTQPA